MATKTEDYLGKTDYKVVGTRPIRHDGADKVQEHCAHALQSLALSTIGKTALRSHADVLPSLRSVAMAEGGLSDEARQFASGALFELDEEVRRKAKEAAKSKLHKRLADRQQEKALSGEDGSLFFKNLINNLK